MAYYDRHQFCDIERDFNSDVGEDTTLVSFSQRVQIHKVGVTVTTSQTGTATIVFEKALAGVLDNVDVATVIVTASSPGKFIYKETNAPLAVLNPGDWLTIDSTHTGTGAKGQIVVEYSYLDEALGDSNETATA